MAWIRLVCASIAIILLNPGSAGAFIPDGHEVIEALA